jgi:hypothetical protein
MQKVSLCCYGRIFIKDIKKTQYGFFGCGASDSVLGSNVSKTIFCWSGLTGSFGLLKSKEASMLDTGKMISFRT